MHEGEVRKARVLARLRIFVAIRIGFDHRVARVAAGALHGDHELDEALVAKIGVETIIVGTGDHEIVHILATAEGFKTIVRAVVDLDMVDDRGRTDAAGGQALQFRSEEHTSELQSLMRISYAVFCLKKKQ